MLWGKQKAYWRQIGTIVKDMKYYRPWNTGLENHKDKKGMTMKITWNIMKRWVLLGFYEWQEIISIHGVAIRVPGTEIFSATHAQALFFSSISSLGHTHSWRSSQSYLHKCGLHSVCRIPVHKSKFIITESLLGPAGQPLLLALLEVSMNISSQAFHKSG